MADVPEQAQITIYTTAWCGYCARARALLTRRGLQFEEVDLTATPRFRDRLVELTDGSTVPQVVIDGDRIGGADELMRLDRAGVLIALARRESFPIERDVERISPRSLGRWAAARLRGRRGVSAVDRRRVLVDRKGQIVGTAGAPAHVSNPGV